MTEPGSIGDESAALNAANDSQRRTSGWDLRNAPKNYVFLALYQAGSSLFAFAAVWIISRRLGTEGYGGIFAVIAASQIAQIFTNWTTVAVVKYGVEEYVETARIARTFWSRLVILTVNLLLFLAITPLWFPVLAGWLKLDPSIVWLVLAHFVVTAFWLHVQMGLQAAKMLRGQGFLQMVERFIIVVAIAGIFWAGFLDQRTAVICYVAAPLIVMFVGIWQLRSLIFVRFAFDGSLFRKVLVYSLPLLPYWVVGYLSGNYVDAAFVSKFLSHSDLGVYAVATQINGIAMQLPTLANTIILPLLLTLQAESRNERSFTYFRKILPGIVLSWGVACSLFACASAFLIPIVFNERFTGAGMPLWVLLTASVFWLPVAMGYSALANARSATYMSLAASAVSAAINIGANFYLIPRFGMVGCAWATLLAYAASVIVFSVLLKRAESMPVSWTFLAFLPSLSGAAVITYYGLPFWALAVCIVVSCLIAIAKKDSLLELYSFVTSLRTGLGTSDVALMK